MDKDTLILFTMPGTCSTGPHILLESLNIPYKVCLVDGKILESDWYVKINPQKQVGALRHGDLVLYENSAILSYLANKYYSLSPVVAQNNPERFGHIMQWLSFITTTVHPYFAIYYHSERFISEVNNSDLLQHVVERLKKNYTSVNNHLSANKYLTGDEYAICDFEAYAVLRWAFVDNIFTTNDFPHIARFLDDMSTLQCIKNVNAIESNDVAKLVGGKFTGYVDSTTIS